MSCRFDPYGDEGYSITSHAIVVIITVRNTSHCTVRNTHFSHCTVRNKIRNTNTNTSVLRITIANRNKIVNRAINGFRSKI